MKYLLVMGNKLRLLSVLFIFVFQFNAKAAEECIPKAPQPQRLVNDFAEVLSSQTEFQLEQTLVNFNDTTSTQITIVTVNDLCGYDPASFAYEIGESWGVGNAEFNNGVVVLVKPKVGNSKGHTFIASGYGVEGVLPDAICKRIIENEMIPAFKQNNYEQGIVQAALIIMDITGGEYSADAYKKQTQKSFPIVPFFFVLFFIVVMLASTFGRARKYAHRNNIGLWTALWLMGSASSRHSGRYNDFSSGGGGFGGFGGGSGGGGFGGFGGGSFGGGGAGGSW
ncbi:MAG: TPM domain-containing protein [Vicingaceae bacterium]